MHRKQTTIQLSYPEVYLCRWKERFFIHTTVGCDLMSKSFISYFFCSTEWRSSENRILWKIKTNKVETKQNSYLHLLFRMELCLRRVYNTTESLMQCNKKVCFFFLPGRKKTFIPFCHNCIE